TVTGGVTTYTDTNVVCWKTYYYRVMANEAGGHFKESWSDTSGAMPMFVSSVPNTHNIRATVVDNSYVLLEWQRRFHKLPFTTVIYRSVDNEEPRFFRELGQDATSLTDMETD